MKTWTTREKAEWGEGAWQHEPDKAQWIAHGLDCLIVRGPSGALCGYVGVPEGHPYFQKHYDEADVEVHGGLTFSAPCANTDDESRGIYHVEQGAANKTVWWLGFDCAHCFDVSPMYAHRYPDTFGDGVYRDFAYVQDQTEQLAEQLKTLSSVTQ